MENYPFLFSCFHAVLIVKMLLQTLNCTDYFEIYPHVLMEVMSLKNQQ